VSSLYGSEGEQGREEEGLSPREEGEPDSILLVARAKEREESSALLSAEEEEEG